LTPQALVLPELLLPPLEPLDPPPPPELLALPPLEPPPPDPLLPLDPDDVPPDPLPPDPLPFEPPLPPDPEPPELPPAGPAPDPLEPVAPASVQSGWDAEVPHCMAAATTKAPKSRMATRRRRSNGRTDPSFAFMKFLFLVTEVGFERAIIDWSASPEDRKTALEAVARVLFVCQR
jgi:hypothetical protein